jgi:hypothetical protein
MQQRLTQAQAERDDLQAQLHASAAQLREARSTSARLQAAPSNGAVGAAAEAGQELQDMHAVLKAIGLAQKDEATRRLLLGALGNEDMPTLLKVIGVALGNAATKQLLLDALGGGASAGM